MPHTGARFFEIDGIHFSEIRDHDHLPPFLMTVVSPSDAWMFISSRGPLTAGRKTPASALFPYTTEDKLHDAVGLSGPVTVLLVKTSDGWIRWEPFDERGRDAFALERRLAKATTSDEVLFEERNRDLGLVFRARWQSSERYGWIRRVELANESGIALGLRVLDGFVNLMPADAAPDVQTRLSVLLDAYRTVEMVPGTELALVRLSSIPIDQPRPNESLRANTVFSIGLEGGRTLVSATQLAAFRRGEPVRDERFARGKRGAYLRVAELELRPEETRRWLYALDVDADGARAVELQLALEDGAALQKAIERDLADCREDLVRLVASADGLQCTGCAAEDARHFANALFNAMRGGVPAAGHSIGTKAYAHHVDRTAPAVALRNADALSELPPSLPREVFLERLRATGDAALLRLGEEYMPLTFSRRHGDPSRPWNTFRIPGRYPRGDREIRYEGNWRDIFQNWEALCTSFPAFAPAAVARFLNASTADGYNPYRISLDGVDWEVHDPEDPWSFIGYWGDHQIVYLERLVALVDRFEPGTLAARLGEDGFVSVDVPYRIAGFDSILENPWRTITFDDARAREIEHRVAREGNEGRLLRDDSGHIVTVTLAEKLLTPLLVKLTNLVPGGGVWMNTQRPEWNDANNAIAGLGLSVVTTAHMHSALASWARIFGEGSGDVELSAPLAQLVDSLAATFGNDLPDSIDPATRLAWTERLGRAGEAHRSAVYRGEAGTPKRAVARERIVDLLRSARRVTERTLLENERSDGLFHSYNLLRRSPEGLGLRRMPLMLEGQVAVLSSGLFDGQRALALLSCLRESALYRADEASYTLYPNRWLAPFLSHGVVTAKDVEGRASLRRLLERGGAGIVIRAQDGTVRFAPDLRWREDLVVALENDASIADDDASDLLDLYHSVFDHEAFPGRSMIFFAYEGLGSIYWHMVSKLILATQNAVRDADPESLRNLVEAYLELRAGLGTHKSPEAYGAFPTDPYSHTPEGGGARQPGLTGQVKEDVMARLGEFGLAVEEGEIRLRDELLLLVAPVAKATTFTYYDVHDERAAIELPERSAALTYCAVPFIFCVSDGAPLILVRRNDGTETAIEGTRLGADVSRQILARSGEIREVWIRSALDGPR